MSRIGKVALAGAGVVVLFVMFHLFLMVGYPFLAPYYWHLTNENPVRFDGREITVPSGWVGMESHGYYFVFIPPYPWEGDAKAAITFIRVDDIGVYWSKEELETELKGMVASEKDDGYIDFEPIDVPLAGDESLCAIGAKASQAGQVSVRCVSTGAIAEYGFTGDREFLPVFHETIANARAIPAD